MSDGNFSQLIWNHYQNHRRAFPWRDVISPYRVFVSEVMLQQTQAHRVLKKFNAFIERFPDSNVLAEATFFDVLTLWSGLGYNRRALNLHKAAQIIATKHKGVIPADLTLLHELPGIGDATAASISAFAFNMPTVFLETNIRTVFIHHFFKNQQNITDSKIRPLVEQYLDRNRPREWYYALMDYGVMIKKTIGNKSKQSAHYVRQSRFLGSDREIRGRILRLLLSQERIDKTKLPILLQEESLRVTKIVDNLISEGMLLALENSLTLTTKNS